MKSKTIILISIATIFIACIFALIEIGRIKKYEQESNTSAMKDVQELENRIRQNNPNAQQELDEMEQQYRGDMQLEAIPDN